MLVLSRKQDEALVLSIPAGTIIPEGFSIRVIRGRQRSDLVQIGIEAPKVVRVLREELAQGEEV